MPEAPERERAALARSKIINKMDGPIKSANFYILRKGEPTRVSVTYNTHTKFAKLCVGKHVVSAKQQKGSKDLPFPLALAVVGLSPLVKVWVNYEPLPKNAFQIKVNDEDLHYLLKEEFDEDPSKTEQLWIALNINDNEDSSGYAGKQWAILGATPWIIEDVEDKIQTALGNSPIHSIDILKMQAKTWVSNQFFDLLLCQDIDSNGFQKLSINNLYQSDCESFEEEVLTRLA